jgi:hypothetical protein
MIQAKNLRVHEILQQIGKNLEGWQQIAKNAILWPKFKGSFQERRSRLSTPQPPPIHPWNHI